MPTSDDHYEQGATSSGRDWLGGVFAFLNAVLTEQEIHEARDINGSGAPAFNWPKPRCIRGRIADLINESFRLQWHNCPLRSELAKFRLFHRDDMADALAVAYSISLCGGDPLDALRSDYCLGRLCRYGLLYWEDIDEIRQRARNHDSVSSLIWNDCGRFVEEGDRMVKYRTPSLDGILLMRGDRRVWETKLTHYCIVGKSRRWEAAQAEFDRRGGYAAFLAREFEWPDPAWINPVSESDDFVPFGKLQLPPTP